MKRIIALFIAISLICLFSSSCGLVYIPNDEEKAFEQLLPKLFGDLDSGDEDAVYNLFSPAVREENDDLKERIALLTALYSGPTDEYDYENVGMQSEEHIGNSENWKRACATIPVRSGGNYYWFYIDLMYENFDKAQVGITQLEFYTAYERCAYHESDSKNIERKGLYLHAEKELCGEVRAIYGQPYGYTSAGRTLNLAEVKDFLENSHSFSAFKEHFGKPNAERIYHYYELSKEGGEPRYLCIGAYDGDGTIYSVTIVDDFKYIKTVWNLDD